MAEWSIAAVLKTVEVKASRGSNPCLSAKMQADWYYRLPFFFNLFSRIFIKFAYQLTF